MMDVIIDRSRTRWMVRRKNLANRRLKFRKTISQFHVRLPREAKKLRGLRSLLG